MSVTGRNGNAERPRSAPSSEALADEGEIRAAHSAIRDPFYRDSLALLVHDFDRALKQAQALLTGTSLIRLNVRSERLKLPEWSTSSSP